MSVVKPVDFLNKFVGFCTKANWLDMEISEALVLRIANQLLCFNCHELGVKPSSKHLSIERLIPSVMIVFVSLFKFDCCSVWFDLSDIEEHLVYFLISVCVRSTEVVRLSDCFFHLNAVHNCKCDISDVNGLYLCVHAFNLPIHSVEHFDLHAPLCCDRWVLVQKINDISGSNNCNIWEDCLYFLFTYPFGSQASRLWVGICSCGRDVNESLQVLAVFSGFCNRHRNSNVCVFEIFFLLVEYFRTNRANYYVTFSNSKANFTLRAKVV